MPRNIRIDCFLESVARYLEARAAGDMGGMADAVAEAERWLAEDWPIARIRETVQPTVEEWLRDYGRPWDKSHTQLVHRVSAAVFAMLQPADRS
ncbi:hypothetical protein [Tautonia sociabilis]|uniref:Uncharacterized protein n=1 Tax=Tautonia sociabilis TaxID=2080755 RepID=A0A432MPR1_9BACT|nr:hypothetical protein [Tautonia sociabilis]RUL89451.1 hypothetical protein TsocGM_01375 [Tautonia sociabilis]